MAYSAIVDLENFGRRVVIGNSGAYVDGSDFHIELPQFSSATPIGAELLEAICVALQHLGITLRFEQDKEGELARISIAKPAGIAYEKSWGGTGGGQSLWFCETTIAGSPLPVQKKLSFTGFLNEPIADNTAIRFCNGTSS